MKVERRYGQGCQIRGAGLSRKLPLQAVVTRANRSSLFVKE
jgi:hypothetical protein